MQVFREFLDNLERKTLHFILPSFVSIIRFITQNKSLSEKLKLNLSQCLSKIW